MPDYRYISDILDVLGSTGTLIIPGLLPLNWKAQTIGENDAKTTVTAAKSASGLSAVFTYQPGGRLTLTYPNLQSVGHSQVPFLRLNGTSEYLDTPDDSYFSPGDGVSDTSFTVSGWTNRFNTNTTARLFSKSSATGTEWQFTVANGDGFLRLAIVDQSVPATAVRVSDSAIPLNKLIHVCAVYDITAGSGATAANGITLYLDGVAIASTATNNAGYVAMENLVAAARIGSAQVNAQYYDGLVGPITYSQTALSANSVYKLYLAGLRAMSAYNQDYRRLVRR